MKKTWTIILKNNDVTERNLSIGIDNLTWGTRTGGIHSEIKSGDHVVFLVGVKTQNKKHMEKHHQPFTEHKYPMYPDETLTKDFISDFEFQIDRIIFGKVTSDFYVDDYKLWPSPDEYDHKKKPVSFKHRFKWVPTHEANNLTWAVSDCNYDFHLSIIAAGKKRAPYPSIQHPHDIEAIESKLKVCELPSTNEETYQGAVETTPAIMIPGGPIEAPQKVDSSSGTGKWPRKAGIAKKAIESASFKCERNSEHITFISRVTNENFVEAHHLVPMEKQGEFNVSLDVPENILSLCPNCHSMFHHSHGSDISTLLSHFLEQRKQGLEERGIHIDLDKLEGFYVKN